MSKIICILASYAALVLGAIEVVAHFTQGHPMPYAAAWFAMAFCMRFESEKIDTPKEP